MRTETETGFGGKTALVLSAGGVYGAYQAGVWKALADSFIPDLVVGASIGSINGWLIASGCSPAELEAIWLDSGSLLAIHPKIPYLWWHGVLDGRIMCQRLQELCERFRPRTELAVVLTEARSMRPVIFSGPDLNVNHLLASCAVPFAYDLKRIGGAFYADGGLLGPLPLWAAEQLGAARVVAVQVMPPIPFPIPFKSRLARNGRPPSVAPVETILIEPAKPLGPYYEILRYRPERIREWIDLGYRDAAAIKHSIHKCFARE